MPISNFQETPIIRTSYYLLKLWFLDRMTLYYEIHREREEPPKEEQAEAKMGGRI
jgi:hypothetical protein